MALSLPQGAQPLTTTLDSSLIIAGKVIKRPKKKQKVLDEDEYLDTLDTIISRDYYPALKPLTLLTGRRQRTGTGGASTGMRSARASVRASFEEETPDVRPKSPSAFEHEPERASTEAQAQSRGKRKEDLSLDQFTSNFTSEDNESFEALVEVEEKRKQEKVFWLEENAKMAAEHIVGRLEDPKRSGLIDSWTYTVRNTLMCFPNADNVVQDHEKPSMATGLPPKSIVPKNTRFPGGFFDAPTEAEEKQLLASVREGGEGPTPMVRGYKFMRTPSPSPAGAGGGGGSTPFTTWGDVVGTPVHLKDEDDDEDSDDEEERRRKQAAEKNTKQFRVPATPSRDQLAWRLDAQVKEKNKRLKATNRASHRRSSGRARTPSTPMLSPAAEALLRRSTPRRSPARAGGFADSQLRASYGTSRPGSSSSFARPSPRQSPSLTPSRASPSPLLSGRRG